MLAAKVPNHAAHANMHANMQAEHHGLAAMFPRPACLGIKSIVYSIAWESCRENAAATF